MDATETTDKLPDFTEIFTEMGKVGATAGQIMANAAVDVGTNVAFVANQTGKAALETAEAASKQGYELIERSTHTAGEAVSAVSDNWLVKNVSHFFKLDWIFAGVDQVDLEKAKAAVEKLQAQHPEESPREIAHRIIVEKSTYAGGVGLVSSFIPGIALALLAIDLVATTRLQSEMILQIASAYGLDLQEPARTGEVLAIFALAMGGNSVVKLGLGTLRNIPIAGAAIGASTNSAVLYSLGLAACQFYETKLQSGNQ
ncbi:hypothetical protein IQ264_13730 [Phormidium sp. LEGE 05292]|uniref:hypothetical protein n=1 Tax=[Phormidium] sp. LEGE 05292 TaxID=767427 RepID=UPI001881B320|nr:hypothetical protein [Phormidium sp. LEGE 05292]MBE9226483.1 hypothetical protein [Phormidium sp. LEGE 05292]